MLHRRNPSLTFADAYSLLLGACVPQTGMHNLLLEMCLPVFIMPRNIWPSREAPSVCHVCQTASLPCQNTKFPCCDEAQLLQGQDMLCRR